MVKVMVMVIVFRELGDLGLVAIFIKKLWNDNHRSYSFSKSKTIILHYAVSVPAIYAFYRTRFPWILPN